MNPTNARRDPDDEQLPITGPDPTAEPRRTAGPAEPRYCRIVGCPTRIILARRGPAGPWKPYEAADRPPWAVPGCEVIVTGTAWRPADLVEDFMTRWEVDEPRARELVAGYPWHRPHRHISDPSSTSTQQEHR